MKLETRLLTFYLTLDGKDQVRLRSLLGPKVMDKIISPPFLDEVTQSLRAVTSQASEVPSHREEYDIAIMQLVRHMVESAPSNVELAKSIEGVVNQTVSRPEKRSKYELQGMLLEALMSANREKLQKLRNEIMHGRIPGKTRDGGSNLDKWFSIILGDQG